LTELWPINDTAPTVELTVALTGDSVCTRRISEHPDDHFGPITEMLRPIETVFTNVEVVLTDERGSPSPLHNISAAPQIAGDLRRLGISLASLAHNHALNLGERAMLQSLATMRSAGIVAAGVGRDLTEARSPQYLETSRGRVALVAATSTFQPRERAADPRPGWPGRPGVNPLQFITTYTVDDSHLMAIKRIAEQTGIEGKRQRRVWLGFLADPPTADLFEFLGSRFKAAERFGEITAPDDADLNGHLDWLSEAQTQSTLVIMSLHSHEAGSGEEDPPQFVQRFARAAIDAGADIFVGHGPHLLRGLEIYRGKPIFYSLGNFIFQYEYVQSPPGERLYSSGDLVPGDFYRRLSANSAKSFPADERFWESVIPTCTFENHRLTAIELHPISLGFGQEMPWRGAPRLLAGPQGQAIVDRFAALSRAFGTSIWLDGAIGRVELD
jgi:poly-gamma-glutamate synthesis protein (capsule biosynthesis protein)